MYKLTTPTFTFKFPCDFDMSTLDPQNTYITFSTKNSKELYTKSGDDLEIGEHTIRVCFLQEETEDFPQEVKAQINWVYNDGGVTKRACTNVVSINVKENLYRDTIETA